MGQDGLAVGDGEGVRIPGVPAASHSDVKVLTEGTAKCSLWWDFKKKNLIGSGLSHPRLKGGGVFMQSTHSKTASSRSFKTIWSDHQLPCLH